MKTTLNRRNILTGILLTIALAAIVACGQTQVLNEEPAAPQVEEAAVTIPEATAVVEEVAVTLPKAPEFTLPAVNKGTDISLAQFQGDKPVVLVFYRAYW